MMGAHTKLLLRNTQIQVYDQSISGILLKRVKFANYLKILDKFEDL